MTPGYRPCLGVLVLTLSACARLGPEVDFPDQRRETSPTRREAGPDLPLARDTRHDRASLDAVAVDHATTVSDLPRADGPSADGPSADGPSHDGPSHDGPSAPTPHLLGLAWTGSAEQLVELDAQTGSHRVLATIPGLTSLASAALAVDPATQRLYQVAYGPSGARLLYTLDARTGATLGTATVVPEFSNLRHNGLGQLLGLSWSGTEQQVLRLQLSGATTILATVPQVSGLIADTIAIDGASNTLYQVATNASATRLLFAIDAVTGVVQGATPLGHELSSLHVDGQGALYGLSWNGTAEEVLKLDPKSGATTLVGTLGSLRWLRPSCSALDPKTRRLYQLGQQLGESNWRLYVFDLNTATLLGAQPIVAQPSNLRLLYY